MWLTHLICHFKCFHINLLGNNNRERIIRIYFKMLPSKILLHHFKHSHVFILLWIYWIHSICKTKRIYWRLIVYWTNLTWPIVKFEERFVFWLIFSWFRCWNLKFDFRVPCCCDVGGPYPSFSGHTVVEAIFWQPLIFCT